MSGRVRSRPKSKKRRAVQESSLEPVVAQRPSDEQPLQEDPPTKNQDITPGQEKEDEGTPVVQGPDLKGDLQKLAQTKTEGNGGDGSDVKGEIPSSLEPVKMLAGGEGEPQV